MNTLFRNILTASFHGSIVILAVMLLRLVLNVPLVWLAPLVGLWPASVLGWLGLVSYSLLSVIGLYCCRGRLTRLAS